MFPFSLQKILCSIAFSVQFILQGEQVGSGYFWKVRDPSF